jgi:hypothetical protein
VRKIDEARLEKDLTYRFEYLAEFIGLGEADIHAIHGAAPSLAPLVPKLVDAVYDQLASYDATWRHFVPQQHGYEGPVAENVESLQMEDEVIQYRKQHLARYLTALVTKEYGPQMILYLDMVGAMHTPAKGNQALHVPLVQMNALLGFVADALVATICSLELNSDTRTSTIRAFTKLLWLQNDLINRHYTRPLKGVDA